MSTQTVGTGVAVSRWILANLPPSLRKAVELKQTTIEKIVEEDIKLIKEAAAKKKAAEGAKK